MDAPKSSNTLGIVVDPIVTVRTRFHGSPYLGVITFPTKISVSLPLT